MMVKRRRIAVAAGLACLAASCALLSPARALAEGEGNAPGPPLKDPERKGWTAGIAFGMGELHTFPFASGASASSEEGPGVSVRVGYCFSQNLMGLLLVDFVKSDDFTNALLGAGLQIYATQRVFVRLGSGLGRLTGNSSSLTGMMTSTADTETKLGVAGHAGLGVEFFQMQHLAFDGEFTTTFNKIVGDSSANLNLSLMLGVQWF
jgi:hypothetical protein